MNYLEEQSERIASLKWKILNLQTRVRFPVALPSLLLSLTPFLNTASYRDRGIYRLALFPAADRPDLVLWALWSRNRNEEVEGAYSHHTALSLYDLSDLNPAKLHMTVPTDFRRNSDILGIIVLHYADLSESDVQTAQGFKFTRPLRTILDLIEAGTVERNFIRQALRQAVDRGLITRQQIRNTQMSGPARKIVEEVLRRAA